MVKALDRRLIRRASATSCGKILRVRYLRKGLVHAGPSGIVSSYSVAMMLTSSLLAWFAVATCSGLVPFSASMFAGCSVVLVLIDLWFMLSRKTPGGIGPR